MDADEKRVDLLCRTMNATINKITMANDKRRGGKGATPAMIKKAEGCLKRLKDSGYMSPHGIENFEKRFNKAKDSSK